VSKHFLILEKTRRPTRLPHPRYATVWGFQAYLYFLTIIFTFKAKSKETKMLCDTLWHIYHIKYKRTSGAYPTIFFFVRPYSHETFWHTILRLKDIFHPILPPVWIENIYFCLFEKILKCNYIEIKLDC